MTALYSIWHLLVDGMCAIAMFGKFIPSDNGYFSILIYNFCAFALQMPFGVLLDALNARDENRKYDFNFRIAAIGVICTVVGAYTNPFILGIGNALFHVGGGVGTIHDNFGTDKSGYAGNTAERYGEGTGDTADDGKLGYIVNNLLIVRLGIFVAPGAIGLYLGTLLANTGIAYGWLPWAGVGMILCIVVAWVALLHGRKSSADKESINTSCEVIDRIDENKYGIAAICLTVVILRSYIGMSVGFSWKTGILAGLLAVLALAGGKMAGGFLAARYGLYRTSIISLALAAVCYLFSSFMPVGLAALFLFNMTMPITLYWIVCAFPQMPGFAFGILTFALFLGFLPEYMGIEAAVGGNFIGCVGSIISLFLISVGLWKRRMH